MGDRHSNDASKRRGTGLSRPRPNTTSMGRPSGRNISFEELEAEWSQNSMMLACMSKGSACNVHENCDGSCSNVHYGSPRLISLTTNLFSMLMPVAAPRPTRATAQDVPRDAYYVEQQNLTKFEYSAINSSAGDIRLLKVKKGLFRKDVVECELVTTSLGLGKEFEALSYCCSSAEMSDVMLCNGKKHLIYPSLNAALKAYRESPLQENLLWTDAVSIDQANKVELSEQIPLMRRIYSEAIGVFVYLGHAEAKWLQGLDLMLMFNVLQQHLKESEELGAISMHDVKLPSTRHPCWKEYLETFSSPWFRRTWILQEITLPKKATVGVGRFLTTWEVLETSVPIRQRAGFDRKILEIKRIARSPNNSSFINLLRATRHFKVSDPGDKIIGVLGMVGDLPVELKSLSDYRLSTAQIYHRAALYLIRDFAVETLEHAGLQRRIGLSDMPSWVPDWCADNMQLNQLPLTLFRPTPFSAGASQGTCVILESEDALYSHELLVFGFCHYTVIKESNAFDHSNWISKKDGVSSARFAWLDSAKACLQGSTNLIYDNIEEAFARTLLVDDLYSGGNAIRSTTAIEDIVPTFRAAMARIEDAKRDKDQDRAFSQLMKGTKKDQIQTCIFQMMAAMVGRRFAITDTGHMCLVPACTEVGDAVAIFFGFHTPFTIRLATKYERAESGLERVHAKLVGDTYMHGVMEGEAFFEATHAKRAPCEIVLI